MEQAVDLRSVGRLRRIGGSSDEEAIGRTATIPITPEIQRIVDKLDQAAQQFRHSLATVPPLGRYEAPDECLMVMFLMARNLEAVTALARRNLALLPSAMTLGRATFEQGLRVKWILYPEDPFEREARWLATLKQSSQHHRLLAEHMEAAGEDIEIVSGLRGTAWQIEQFSAAVERGLLPKGDYYTEGPKLREYG